MIDGVARSDSAKSEGSGALPVKPEPIDKIRDRELRRQVFKISFSFGAMKIPGIAPWDGNFVYRYRLAKCGQQRPSRPATEVDYLIKVQVIDFCR